MEDNIKIIEYKDLNRVFNNQTIHDFINFCMHKFIGKPLQQRQDIIDIQKYYLKNGGNFWVAIDEEKNMLVGTVALQKRENDGIVRRLYVDENYQSLGIGNRLYAAMEEYAINKTDITTLYLACGKILKNAHSFYKKRGFEQIDGFGIGMNVSEEDDYFKKEIARVNDNNSVDNQRRKGLLQRVKVSQEQNRGQHTNEVKTNTEKLTYDYKQIEEK